MRTIKEIIEDSIRLIEGGSGILAKEIVNNVEPKLFRGIKDILAEFNSKDGNFDEESDSKKLLEIDGLLTKAVDSSGLKKSADKFKVNFNLIDDLTKEFFMTTLRLPEDDGDLLDVFKKTSPEKAKIINDLDLRILNNGVLRANVLNEVRDEIFEAVVFKRSVKELTSKIRTIVITNDGADSKLLRYVKQVSNDVLSDYHGTLQNKGQEIYALDKVTVSGTVQNNTRQFCFDILRSVGRYEKFALRRATYRVKDLDKISELAYQCVPHHTLTLKRTGEPVRDCGRGVLPGMNATNIATNKKRPNCLHQWFFSRMTDRDRRVEKEKGLDDL